MNTASGVRDLLEISRRNELRREAGLPLLEIAKEWRRLKQAESNAELDRYEAVHGLEVFEQVLKEAGGWLQPRFIFGMLLQNKVRRILREQLRANKQNKFMES